ncbi:MAG TPA: hypothetical protein VFE47_14930 [Tepidisphaeraceae bacterium]|jgi:hypothetical protein|nr:hypothetical protein [Tepidisphaeraceae bacterium]
MDLQRSLGLSADGTPVIGTREELIRYINLKLAALGANVAGDLPHTGFLTVAHDLLADFREFRRLLDGYLCPADQRIQDFLDAHFADVDLVGPIRLPSHTFVVDRHGMSREMSLPIDREVYGSDAVRSYRVRQGVLHNPKSDRRTTQGVFHVAEGGLPVPADKVAVPKKVYGNLLHAAFNPPAELLKLPFTASNEKPAELFCSLLLRPAVCPEIPGFAPAKSMEVRFFAPGSLVSNLDFVESIFGNAGDPYLPENDAGLDVAHWTGHTGCIILAPHLVALKKKSLGLPHWDHATERQRRDGVCWKNEDEPYNDGKPFKITCRTTDGVMVTILADNYFGYSKKEIKTQISYSANLFGVAEEEHAGGALAFSSYSLGEQFKVDNKIIAEGYTFAEAMKTLGDAVFVQPEGYAIDRMHPSVIYVPEDVEMHLPTQRVWWTKDGKTQEIKLMPDKVYVHPTGYKIRMEKHPGAPSWRLVGTRAEGTFCHKPCTVSGGGKSEISKSISGSVVYGPIYVSNWEADLDRVEKLLARDYSDRFLPDFRPDYTRRDSRALLSPARSLGSVIKMLTPSPGEFTDEYNAWLDTIPNNIRALVFFIKRFYRPEWGDNWRRHFSVDNVNGAPGHELKFGPRKAVGSYLRIGLEKDGSWRLFKLRQDFIAADKVQMEDDISASAVVPLAMLPNKPKSMTNPSVKLVENCEWRLFQRPDDAIHRGMDAQTEHDMAQPGLFASNYEPINAQMAHDIAESVVEFDKFTAPMRETIIGCGKGKYVVCSANPRIVDGKPSKNPRYLQIRPDVAKPRDRHIAEVGARLFRRAPIGQPIVFPVSAVLSGRRNNPSEPGIRPLAVYNPIHYQRLPELFMDFICSLTGKSPSTTGAGSEGALTKGPFNALRPAADLNNALVDFLLTGYDGYSTAAGHIGPDVRVDHDISLLIPEIWARLTPAERDAETLIKNGYMEKLADFEHQGKPVLASRLGYRITAKFIHDYFGRVFDNPATVFDERILRPESQDLEMFVDGVRNIVEAQQRVARTYFEDGTIDECCPPLQELLKEMAAESVAGAGADRSEKLSELFSRERLMESDWYQQRLVTKQRRDVALWERHVAYLESFLARPSHADVAETMGIAERLESARQSLEEVMSPDYLDRLRGTIGADPLGMMEEPAVAERPALAAVAT